MPTAVLSNGIEICFESFGPVGAPPLLLVQGLGAQLTGWPPGFVAELLDRGFRVIRYDNRDCGLSSKTPGTPPNAGALLMAALSGESVEAPYTLSTLAADAVALLDHLDIAAAHVVGASMGGMIVQTIAIEHPDRVRSLTSIMSSTGDPSAGAPEPSAMTALLTPPSSDRARAVAAGIELSRILCGPLFDEEAAGEFVREQFDRSFHPAGVAFQLAAIAASGDRTPLLAELDVPALVIHGRVDPLITLSGGLATAAAIDGADLLVLAYMGHDLPEQYWGQMADAITGTARSGDHDHDHDDHAHDHDHR